MTHIIDTLIEERATRLRRHPKLWSLIQRYMYPMFGYQTAVDLVERVQSLSGFETFSLVSDLLELQVTVEGLEHLPKEGRAVVMPNHPTGIADGIAVFDALRDVRPDMAFFANRDAVRCHDRLSEIIIPVEWMEEKRNHSKSKEMFKHMLQAFRDERLVVIFASGRLAEPTLFGLRERPWLSTGVGLAQRFKCPIVPMHITATNSVFFYLLWFINTELKDMTLFRELLNKKNHRYHIKIGAPVVSDLHPEHLSVDLRRFVTEQLANGNTDFKEVPED